MAKRQQFTKEFKLEAVRLWKSSGRPAVTVARELAQPSVLVAPGTRDARRGRLPGQGRLRPQDR